MQVVPITDRSRDRERIYAFRLYFVAKPYQFIRRIGNFVPFGKNSVDNRFIQHDSANGIRPVHLINFSVLCQKFRRIHGFLDRFCSAFGHGIINGRQVGQKFRILRSEHTSQRHNHVVVLRIVVQKGNKFPVDITFLYFYRYAERGRELLSHFVQPLGSKSCFIANNADGARGFSSRPDAASAGTFFPAGRERSNEGEPE